MPSWPIVIAIAFLFSVWGLWLWSSSVEETENVQEATPIASDSGIILFFGNECPHCHDLDEEIEKNKIAEKVPFDSLEVWHNAENQKIFEDKAFECGYRKEQLGVPFLYADGKCYIGTPDIMEFFRKEAPLP